MNWFRRRTPPLSAQTKKNIESVAQIEREFLRERSAAERASDAITRFVGSMTFVACHVALFTAWFVLNSGFVLGPRAFDGYPYQFLNLALALEGIFLSTFVLMSQNRQNAQAEQWAQLGLQVNLLAEQEATQMLRMLRSICDRLGVEKDDRQLKEMIETTHLEVLAQELEKSRDALEASEAEPGGA
jgi:uncharacterized membrane protein